MRGVILRRQCLSRASHASLDIAARPAHRSLATRSGLERFAIAFGIVRGVRAIAPAHFKSAAALNGGPCVLGHHRDPAHWLKQSGGLWIGQAHRLQDTGHR